MGKGKNYCHYGSLKLFWVYRSLGCWVIMSGGAWGASVGKSGMIVALEGKLELIGKWCHQRLAQCSLGLVGFLGCLKVDCSSSMLGCVDWWDVGQGGAESGVGVPAKTFAAGSSGFAGGQAM